MSGFCPDCGNTGCECDEVTRATYPLRCKVDELERKLSSTVKFFESKCNKLLHAGAREAELKCIAEKNLAIAVTTFEKILTWVTGHHDDQLKHVVTETLKQIRGEK